MFANGLINRAPTFCPYIILILYKWTGSSPLIYTVPKTVETGGTIYRLCGYTYFCAEEPASCGPTIERTTTVEPDVAAVVQEANSSLIGLSSASEARR